MYVSASVEGSQAKRRRAPHQLPSGRHGLSREFVVQNQHERILAAVAEVCSDLGYAKMSVEDICQRSGVSRRTFYDHFKSKEEVFLAAYDEAVAELMADVLDAYNAHEGLVDRARECIRAFLEYVASEPVLADMCIVEVLAAGPAAIERRNNAMAALAQLINQAVGELPKSRRPPDLTAETLVGGIYEVVYSRVLAGRTSELVDLLPDLTYSMLLPYIGPEAAAKEHKKLVKAGRAL